SSESGHATVPHQKRLVRPPAVVGRADAAAEEQQVPGGVAVAAHRAHDIGARRRLRRRPGGYRPARMGEPEATHIVIAVEPLDEADGRRLLQQFEQEKREREDDYDEENAIRLAAEQLRSPSGAF